MNTWSDLPNAKYIAAVIAAAEQNPDKLAFARTKTRDWSVVRHKARQLVFEAIEAGGLVDTWDDLFDSLSVNASCYPVYDAITALMVYDCAHLLTSKPEHVKMLADMGDDPSLLIYPIIKTFQNLT